MTRGSVVGWNVFLATGATRVARLKTSLANIRDARGMSPRAFRAEAFASEGAANDPELDPDGRGFKP
jgi:hypothetical protein